MKRSELNYYELIELLRSFHEYLSDIEGDSIVIPKKHQPYVKDVVHECIGDIIMMLCCIDTTINPELLLESEQDIQAGLIRADEENENEN